MPKRKKRNSVAKKRKDDECDNDDIDGPLAKKVAVASSTSDSISQASSFNVEAVNIGQSNVAGGEVGFSSHFWCNYCEYSSDTKKELVSHMRQHMTKCAYCNFSSLSKAEIAKHVKCEHEDEAEKTICEVDSSSSGTEHDMDKDPCSACIFCDFMTYSTEHLEKHTLSKHQGMLPKSVAKMISKQVSARVRKDDAFFYCAISSDNFEKPNLEGENCFNLKTDDSNEKAIIIEAETDVKPKISPQSPDGNVKDEVKPNPQALSKVETNDTVSSLQTQDTANVKDWRVKVETLYCLSCPYSNVAIEKLKCHALTQHPDSVAAASFISEATHRLQDITFYCVRESCPYTSVQCGDYEDHLVKCCSLPESLLFGEKERLKCTIKFILKCQEKKGDVQSEIFLKFSSQYISHQQPSRAPSPTNQGQMNLGSRSINTGQQNNGNNLAVSCSQNNCNSSLSSSAQMPIHNTVCNSGQVPQMATTHDNLSANLNTITPSQTVNRQGNASNQSVEQNSSTGVQNFQQSDFCGQWATPVQQQQDFHRHQFSDSCHQNSKSSSSDNLQQNSSLGVHNSNSCQQPCNPAVQSQYNSSIHKQQSGSVNFNTTNASVEQQNMHSTPQPEPNPEIIMAPSFDSHLSIMPGQDNIQLSFTHQKPQRTYHDNNNTLTTGVDDQSATVSTELNVSQPKMIDILSDANAILLDNDLSMQPWPATEVHDILPDPNVEQSQSSLHTPPLPQETTKNPSIFVTANLNSGTPPLTPSVPHSDASTTSTLPPQFPTGNTNSFSNLTNESQHSHGQQPETVIDLDSPQSITAPVSSQPMHQIPTISAENPPSHQSIEASDVPNFLVPSISESIQNNSQHPDSFLTNPIQPQLQNDQTIPLEYPSTPPSQKNIPAGQSRFPTVNSPLSPSIYLSGNGMRPQRSSSIESSPMQPAVSSPMRPPPPQGMNPAIPAARQRLFTPQGQPRGPAMQPTMVRPPASPVDDDVIVTAVVRGPAPQRPPMNPRGRGMATGGRDMPLNQRGMAPRARGMATGGRGMAPSGRGLGPSGRGMAPTGRGVGPSGRALVSRGRGMTPSGRGMAPGRRGMSPFGRGMGPNGRGSAGMPLPRGRGGMPRGRGGSIAPSMSPQGKNPMDVSGHFADLACVVNDTEEEGDEIQIVGVTPGKGGSTQLPKAVNAKNFSYCCIHCGQDQGSKEVMKRHIKSVHSQSLLGAFRNIESGQWLFFCPQLTCEFMTYDENRLINHLFSCYNLDKSKPLPYDMQSALKNLKSLRMRHVNVQGHEGRPAKNPVNMDGQGLRDAFNNNLKDAFDDMVENTMGRQMMRPTLPPQSPNQRPPLPNQQPSPSYTNQRGALRGPYSPRGIPPRSIRQGLPGPGQMSPGYRQRSPMIGGSPRQPRYPGGPGQPRFPNQPFQTRGRPPGRGGFPPRMRGQRPSNPTGGFTPRPNHPVLNLPGNEQSPIIIDLDMDSPEKSPDNSSEVQESAPTTAEPDNARLTSISINEPPTSTVEQLTAISPADHSDTGATPLSSILASNASDTQAMISDPAPRNESALGSGANNFPTVPGADHNDTSPPLHHSSDTLSVVDNIANGDNQLGCISDKSQSHEDVNKETSTNDVVQTSTQPISSSPANVPASPKSVKNIPSPSHLLAEMNAVMNKQGSVPFLPSGVDANHTSHEDVNKETSTNDVVQTSTQPISSSPANVPASPKSVKNIPSPSHLLAEMNAVMNKQGSVPSLQSGVDANQTQPQPELLPPEQSPQSAIDGNSLPPSIDEELVNTILLDKVFAKVPHMPKKLSQRLVLKFKKYAADRGMVITPTSRVIDEFVSKISYKGSHSAPTPMPVNKDDKNSNENNQPPQPVPLEKRSELCDDTKTSSSSLDQQTSTNSRAGNPILPCQTPSVVAPSSSSDPAMKSSFSSFNSSANESGIVQPCLSVTKSDDVIETKVIFAERKLEFKGAFANIIKEKNVVSTSPVSPMPTKNNDESSLKDVPANSTESSQPYLNSKDDMTEKANGSSESDTSTNNLKKEIIEPVHFPSVSKENSIEVKSSVDHIVSAYAGLEVDIAGKPLSANAFTSQEEILEKENEKNRALTPIDEDISEKEPAKVSSMNSAFGTLNFKVRKGSKPRAAFSITKEDEITLDKSQDSNDGFASEDQLVRRSERKRKAVKLDYNVDEEEMDALMSDDDDEYHLESDESYDGSDSDERGRKKAKKPKVPQDPTDYDFTTKGYYGCWKCNKVFSRVMFLKRHIIKKHKEGLCAVVLTESGIPSKDQPSVLLFCPQSCKYVTSHYDAYPCHMRSCIKSPLNIENVDYKSIQETFFKNDFKTLCESIASGAISTKIPVESNTPSKKKSSSSTQLSVPPGSKPDMVNVSTQPKNGSQQMCHASSIVTTAVIHQPPPQPMPHPYPHSLPPHDGSFMMDQPGEVYHDDYFEDKGDPDMFYQQEQY